MKVLVDTNLLLRSLQPDSPHFQMATQSLRRLRQADELCVTPQNLYELLSNLEWFGGGGVVRGIQVVE
jgi:hypothetical protein